MTPRDLDALVAAIEPPDERAARQARARHDRLAKPPGSLGALERLGARLAAIAGTAPPPPPEHPAVIVAAADHGVHAEGVTAWPQSITTTMVGLFRSGRASVNQVAASVGAQVHVLDVGCAGPLPEPPPAGPGTEPAGAGTGPGAHLHTARVRAGTGNLVREPAMTRDDVLAALASGAALAAELVAEGADLLVTGDMGIANTTATACLVAVFTGAPAEAVTGRGAGADDAMLARKQAVVGKALAQHAPDPSDPIGVLAAVGGLEHAALAGVVLAAAAARRPVVLDGVITTAAALAAAALAPAARGCLVASHRSVEPGAAPALAHLGLDPLLDLELRLGEGTGGLLAVPLVVAAARVLAGTATIDEVAGG